MPIVKTTKAELRKAIREKCKDCMGYEDYRRRIKECDSDYCSLHKYRPYQTIKD